MLLQYILLNTLHRLRRKSRALLRIASSHGDRRIVTDCFFRAAADDLIGS